MQKIIIGNWKTNQIQKNIKAFFKGLNREIEKGEGFKCRFGIAPVFIHLQLVQSLAPKKMIVAAQDVNYVSSGAYTGTVSWSQLEDIKIKYAIVGHSERRLYYNETDDSVNQKVKSLLKNNMVPILCIGEKLNEFNEQKTNEVCERQLKTALKDVPTELLSKLIIAYEPIWAIGTGKASTPENAQKVIHYIREVLGTIIGSDNAKKNAILYGGSVTPGNIKSFISQEDIDGALVGSASLNVDDYISLLKSC